MKNTNQERKFKVIISGGGIAGLTLANALQAAGVDYLLLEARAELAPQLGASIGLGPNGSRILDQLGCYDEILSLTEPIEFTGSHRGDNGNYIRPKTDAFRLVLARANYCMCFLDRQAVLKILASHITDKEKVLLNKRVEKAEEHSWGVTVRCKDGTSYTGDILVGADGIFSTVRQEMWRFADVNSPGKISDSERTNMLAEYKCLFGISAPIPGLPAREFDVTYKKDISPIVITTKGGRVYWFLIAKMAQVYRAGEIPRFSKEDAQAFAEANLDIPVMPGAKVTVRDLWDGRKTYNLVALEEAYYTHWTHGRFVCLGDSMHKMTPNIGAGGNSAIESAAALANSLHEMMERVGDNSLTADTIQAALLKYQETRSIRASSTVKVANMVTRLHAVRSSLEYIASHYILPRAGDLLVDLASDSWIGAILINYMPVPKRSLGGTMPFNPEQGLGKNESMLRRALLASPFLALSIYHFQLLKHLVPWKLMRVAVDTGELSLGSANVTLFKSFYHINFIDSMWRGIVLLFVPSTMSFDIGGHWQMPSFLADFGTVYALILIESARRANLMTPLAMPLVFGIGSQLFAAGSIMPLYCFLYYTLVPISRFRATDLRLTDMSYTRSILPVMLATYHVPYLLSYFGRHQSIQQAGTWVFTMSALWTSLGQWVLKKTVIPSTIQNDRIDNVNRDMKTIKFTVGFLALWSSVSWLNILIRAPRPLMEIFLPTQSRSTLFLGSVQKLIRYDHIFFSGSSLLWIIYLYGDLKKAGMIRHNWATIVSALAGLTCSVGPGAAVAAAWLYREQILATKRHKGAII